MLFIVKFNCTLNWNLSTSFTKRKKVH